MNAILLGLYIPAVLAGLSVLTLKPCDLVSRLDAGIPNGTSIRDLASRAEVGENEFACPACGRHTLRRIPYEFFWCLRRGSRYKRVGRGECEDAGGPDDDGFFWLWTIDVWLTKPIRRITRKGHPSG